MHETDAQLERRLAREARDNYRGRIADASLTTEAIANRDAQVARVEVTYQATEDDIQRAGFYRVFMPYDVDPWEYAYDAVTTKMKIEWPAASYLSVDDIYSD